MITVFCDSSYLFLFWPSYYLCDCVLKQYEGKKLLLFISSLSGQE